MTTSIAWFAALYAAFALKQFLADFVLQLTWMAAGKEQTRGWAVPLAAHAGCHAALTLLLMLLIAPGLWWLGPADFLIHGGIDRAKSLASRRLNLKQNSAAWWWLFGADQLLHHLTHLAFIVLIAELQ
ncbi:MAG TPA: DUF3307 domain-containing protein [Xanthobacteraceae bacterium]|jgi:hypothetical protein